MIELALPDRDVVLSEAEARRLYRQLGDALPRERTFVRTTGRHRSDGRYVVERRGAESAGQRKVFESFEELSDRYEALPNQFTASDLGGSGLTGSRRHAVLWHLVEHPAFDCTLVGKQPLTASKQGPTASPARANRD